jgi:hypothetical protein
VVVEPGLESVCCLLGKIAASLPVESALLKTDMLVKADLIVAILIARVRWSGIRRAAVVRIMRAIVAIGMGGWWGILVVTLPVIVACTVWPRWWRVGVVNRR